MMTMVERRNNDILPSFPLMSSEDLPRAPPPEAFRNNEAATTTTAESSPVSKLGKRSLSALLTSDREGGQQSLAPPPPVRRASSITASTTSSQQPFSRPLVRRRSSLFDTIPGRSRNASLHTVPEASPPSFLQRLSQNSTLLAEDVSTSNPPTVGTPQRRPRGSLFGAVMEKLGTKTSPDVAAAPFMSPTGKSILNIVNRITSPFRFQSPPPKSPPAKRRLLSSSVSPMANHKQTEDSQSSLHDDDNWKEAPIQDGQAEILDWTLKTKIQLECHSPEALAAIWQTREWRESLGYWAYLPPVPQIEPHQEIENYSHIQMSDKSKSAKVPDKPASKDAAVALASRIVKRVKTAATQNTSQQCWQQSFRSLFFQWRRRVEEEKNPKIAILDYYFYCISEDHVVLFRVDLVNDVVQPRVLLSKCSEAFRELLRDHGAESIARLKEPTTFEKIKGETKDNLIMSPTVKADLEALRKAQAFGEVAGADVSIKIKARKKGSKNATHVSENLAITLAGHDDVATFFEVYFNVLGRVQEIKETEDWRQLPKLFCPRQTGPFWHASMEFLHLRPVKPKSVEAMLSGILEVQGEVILPCLIRRLVALSANQVSSMLPQSNPLTEMAPLTIRSPSKETAGSHYVVFHTIIDEANTTNLARMKSPTMALERATNLFNGIIIIEAPKDTPDVGGHSNTSTELIAECRSGTTLQLIVWDISRSKVAACKVGALP